MQKQNIVIASLLNISENDFLSPLLGGLHNSQTHILEVDNEESHKASTAQEGYSLRSNTKDKNEITVTSKSTNYTRVIVPVLKNKTLYITYYVSKDKTVYQLLLEQIFKLITYLLYFKS